MINNKYKIMIFYLLFEIFCSIGLGIAKDLGKQGAKVVISSRKEENVLKATESLLKEGFDVKGVVCHVSKSDHRENLVNFVCMFTLLTC